MMAESDFTRGRSNTSSVCTALWSGPASGTRQLQYSLDVPGWFCERVSADAVHQRRLQKHGWRAEQHLVHRLDDLLNMVVDVRGDFRRDQFAFDQSVKHGLTFRGCGRLEFFDRAGEQVQLLTQSDVLELTGSLRLAAESCVVTEASAYLR